jgi:hypothetical protein
MRPGKAGRPCTTSSTPTPPSLEANKIRLKKRCKSGTPQTAPMARASVLLPRMPTIPPRSPLPLDPIQAAPAYTDTMTNGGTVSSAVVTFDLQATIPGSSTLVYDPTGPGASTFFLKVALHEIGHTMGLDEIPDPPSGDACDQVDGASVMNAGCNQDDSGGNLPTDVTSCDNAVVATEVYQVCQAIPAPAFSAPTSTRILAGIFPIRLST